MDEFLSEDSANLPQVLLVDDEHFVHDLVGEALKNQCILLSVEDCPGAIMAVEVQTPDLIILDVELPGMSGIDLCRFLRERTETSHTPIVFLSAHDEITDRLAGYDAGADDYITKPFSMRELRAKVLALIHKASLHRELESSVALASSTAMTAMTSMGEIGVLLEALKTFNGTHEPNGIAQAIISALDNYGLSGATQIRFKQQELALNMQGEAAPIEVAIIEKMIGMDRIFQFGNRLIITYEHVSLLVSNLPNDDPDRVGRLRDHLAMLAEGADVRIQAIIAEEESRIQNNAIQQTLVRITEALRELDSAQRNTQIRTNLAISEMSENVGKALLSVALSEEQEDYLAAVIRTGVDQILDIHSNQSDLQNKLSSIIHDLKVASFSANTSAHSVRLVWSDFLNVNHPMIDEDHKTLLIHVNQLYSAIEENHTEKVAQNFEHLLRHTREHFAREEELMKESAYPGLLAHTAEHEKLLKELLAQQDQITQNSNIPDAFETLKNLATEHIVHYDRLLGNHLNKISKAA